MSGASDVVPLSEPSCSNAAFDIPLADKIQVISYYGFCTLFFIFCHWKEFYIFYGLLPLKSFRLQTWLLFLTNQTILIES
jgi:hypothetical protein